MFKLYLIQVATRCSYKPILQYIRCGIFNKQPFSKLEGVTRGVSEEVVCEVRFSIRICYKNLPIPRPMFLSFQSGRIRLRFPRVFQRRQRRSCTNRTQNWSRRANNWGELRVVICHEFIAASLSQLNKTSFIFITKPLYVRNTYKISHTPRSSARLLLSKCLIFVVVTVLLSRAVFASST